MHILHEKGISPIVKQKKINKKKSSFLLCLPLLQRNSDLTSATVGFLGLLCSTTNLHIIHKTFTLTYPCISKSKYKTHPRNRVIIERFQKRSNEFITFINCFSPPLKQKLISYLITFFSSLCGIFAKRVMIS